jgi:DNA-binding transcriptional regulator YiaG
MRLRAHLVRKDMLTVKSKNDPSKHIEQFHEMVDSPAPAADNGSSHTRLVILHAVAFADALKCYRTRLFEKQCCLAQAIGCSEAAVSYWETGRRLPQRRTFHKILEVLATAGVSATDRFELQRTWLSARIAERDGSSI